MISSIKAASILAFFSTLASTAPSSFPNYPPTSLSQNFRLVANVTSTDLATPINNYVLTSYHIGAGQAYAVLVPNTTVTTGRIFYINGTAEDVRYNNGNTLSDEGTPLFPGGVTINADSTVSINAGVGEFGIGLTSFPDPISELTAGEEGEFYACFQEVIPGGSAVQLLYKSLDIATPEGCADVSLLPQCSEGSGLVHPLPNTVNCYADVAGIDWTFYDTD